jgi:ATP-dependent RNA helicase DeaD
MSVAVQSEEININGFNELGLPDSLLRAISTLGYTIPTPIQSQAIPPLLAGEDVLGKAQTGTGKTAAFALPLLAKIQAKRRETQILVLVPTRELALQVAEAFAGFAVNMPEINILPIYGGQGYSTQLTMLRKGAHIVIGTPGRVMDHMRRGSLKLDSLKTLILDEADEMLRMGFAEDVEWILEQTPSERQIGLFSATMPPAIKSIADTYLRNPQIITVKNTATSNAAIRQCYWLVSNLNKLDALCRIIETEESDAIIVFVRTKRATEELAEQLVTRGFNAVPINGDIVQQQRERVIEQLKSGRIKILVATDVAARGIDVDRVTHVINYDVPNNPESYTHRIGRTGRAGRKGTAILFIAPKDKYLLRNIERVTKQEIELMEPPSVKTINERRVAAFKQRITAAIANEDLSFFETLITQYLEETDTPAIRVAASLAKMLQGNNEFLLQKNVSMPRERDGEGSRSNSRDRDRGDSRGRDRDRGESRSDSRGAPRGDFREKYQDKFPSKARGPAGRTVTGGSRDSGGDRFESSSKSRFAKDAGMDQYRVDVGGDDGIEPRNLVGAIANTAGIEGRLIGKIKIEPKFSFIDLPKGMPRDVLKTLQKLKVSGKQMNLQKVNS